MSIIVNNKPIEYFNFSGGECYVSIKNILIDHHTKVVAHLRSSDDVMRLIMVVDAIRRKNMETRLTLIIPYFPYARQDRVCNDGEPFSLSVMADVVNSLRCDEVVVYDPHSEVTEQLLNNCRVVTQVELIKGSVVASSILEKDLLLISPDKGAAKKTQQVSLELGVDVLFCSKKRDPKTGRITKTKIFGSPSGKDCLIIDDICDGGATFIELAKVLKKAGAKDIYLYVTHGIFSKGLENLKKYLNHIYCFNCFLKDADIDNQFLTLLTTTYNENKSINSH